MVKSYEKDGGKMKVGRQSKIIELITKYEIETQEELAQRLLEAGYHVTQATISRDIRELKLTKVTAERGKQKYIVLNTKETEFTEKYVRVLKDGFLSMDQAQNKNRLWYGNGSSGGFRCSAY